MVCHSDGATGTPALTAGLRGLSAPGAGFREETPELTMVWSKRPRRSSDLKLLEGSSSRAPMRSWIRHPAPSLLRKERAGLCEWRGLQKTRASARIKSWGVGAAGRVVSSGLGGVAG